MESGISKIDKPVNQDVSDFLEHYGVKGMRWGVRNDRSSSGGTSGSSGKSKSELTAREKAVLEKVGADSNTSERLKSMYGPGSNSSTQEGDKFHLTSGQKKALFIGGGVVVAGLAAYGVHKYVKGMGGPPPQPFKNPLDDIDDLSPEEWAKWVQRDLPEAMETPVAAFSPQFTAFLNAHNTTASTRFAEGYTEEFVNSLSDESVNLSVGSIVKRISMDNETEIRPDGFFAAHLDEDVERYKAVLPVYWKQWAGPDVKEGHVVSLEALTEIRAPSKKRTFDMFKQMLDDDLVLDHLDLDFDDDDDDFDFDEGPTKVRDALRMLHGDDLDDDSLVRKVFPGAALGWANKDDPMTATFMKRVKSEGYNSLIDMNDAGSIGDTPLRILDGTLFKISKTELLTTSAISAAQDSILSLVHMLGDFLKGVLPKGKFFNLDVKLRRRPNERT